MLMFMLIQKGEGALLAGHCKGRVAQQHLPEIVQLGRGALDRPATSQIGCHKSGHSLLESAVTCAPSDTQAVPCHGCKHIMAALEHLCTALAMTLRELHDNCCS